MWKQSEIWKNRKFHIVLVIEILVLLVGVWGLFLPNRVLDIQDMEIAIYGGETRDDGSYYVDGQSGVSGIWLQADGFTLEPGVYNLKVFYKAEQDGNKAFGITASENTYRGLLSNMVSLYSGVEVSECQFYVTAKTGPEQGLRVVVEYQDTASLTVHGIEIYETNQGNYVFLFVTLLLSLIINILMILHEYIKRCNISSQWWLVRLGIMGVVVLSSLPVFTDYILNGPDTGLHLLRIEFLAKSFQEGIIPARIEPFWLYGHGYANSIFYCDTFLVVPAMLRIIGFPMVIAYGAYIFMVNAMTAVASYWSFKGMFRNCYIGMFGCMLYTLLPYRIYNVFNRGAIGEYTAMIFLPIICYGFYLLLVNDTNEKNYKKHWPVLMLGFSGVIQCHVLSCEIMVGATVLLCVLCIHRVFRKQTLLQLIKAVGGTVLLNMWFVVPMLDMMVSGEYYYSRNAGNAIQHRGILPANILFTLQRAGDNSRFAELGMQGAEPIGVGAAILICIVVYLLMRKKEKKNDPIYDKVAMVALWLGGIITIMSLDIFPWDRIQQWNGITKMLVPMVQFPTRFTIVVGVTFTIVACVGAKWVLDNKKQSARIAFCCVSILLSVGFSMFQTNDILMNREGVLRIHSMEGMGHSGILGAEYLPLESDYSLRYHGTWPSEDVTVLQDSKQGLETYTTVSVNGQLRQESAWIEVPMLYYKGYRAEDAETGKPLAIALGTNAHARIFLEEGYRGTVHVWYNGMWYWKVAEAVSLIWFFILIIMEWVGRIKKNK